MGVYRAYMGFKDSGLGLPKIMGPPNRDHSI